MNTSNYPYLIGCDPSLTCTGFAVFTSDGKYQHKTNAKTTADMPMSERYSYIVEVFLDVLRQFPTAVIVSESQYLQSRGKMFKAMLITPTIKGVLIGAYITHCQRLNIQPRILEVTTTSAKKKIGIKKSAKRKENKQIIKAKIQELYPNLTIKNQDEIDAIMIGMAGCMVWEEERKHLAKV